MKKFIVSIIAAIITVSCFAQNLNESKIEGNMYVTVQMNTESQDLGDVKIMLKSSTAKKFVKDLRRIEKKLNDWTATAKQKNVKDYKKTLEGSYSYNKLGFNNEDGDNLADYNYNNYLVPYFTVDSEGQCKLVLGGYYSGYNTSDLGSNYVKRNKFFFYMSIPVNELSSWINDLEVASNEINNKQKDVDAKNDIFMATR